MPLTFTIMYTSMDGGYECSPASKAVHSGYIPRKLNSKQSVLIDFRLLQARRMIALFWKNMQMPSVKLCLKETATYLALTYIVKEKRKQFN